MTPKPEPTEEVLLIVPGIGAVTPTWYPVLKDIPVSAPDPDDPLDNDGCPTGIIVIADPSHPHGKRLLDPASVQARRPRLRAAEPVTPATPETNAQEGTTVGPDLAPTQPDTPGVPGAVTGATHQAEAPVAETAPELDGSCDPATEPADSPAAGATEPVSPTEPPLLGTIRHELRQLDWDDLKALSDRIRAGRLPALALLHETSARRARTKGSGPPTDTKFQALKDRLAAAEAAAGAPDTATEE